MRRCEALNPESCFRVLGSFSAASAFNLLDRQTITSMEQR